jgi:putative acetyltransferase
VTVTIAPESPRQAEIVRLVEELDEYLGALYPAASNHLLDIETLAQPDIRFFVARREGEALGCVALRVDPAGYGEVKRLYVPPRARGLALGRRLLAAIEEQARRERLTSLRLETGIHQPEALGLFCAAGFVEIAPFASYSPDPLSVFMEKTLTA